MYSVKCVFDVNRNFDVNQIMVAALHDLTAAAFAPARHSVRAFVAEVATGQANVSYSTITFTPTRSTHFLVPISGNVLCNFRGGDLTNESTIKHHFFE